MYMNDGNKTKINLRNKSVFITGVAGFIGSNLAKRLLSTVEGVKVVGLDNMNHYYDVRLKEARLNELEQFDNFSFVKGNLADKAVIESIFEQYKPEIVVNLGAQAGVRYSITNPDAYVEANLIGFYNILEACRHSYDEGHTPVEHLVYASSSSVYGSNKKVPYSTDDKVDNPVSLYAATKKSNELMAHARNLNCCIIGSSGSGKTRFWLTPQLLQAHSSYVVVDPKGGVLGQVGGFLQKRGYKIKVFNSIDFSKSMHYNPLAYIRNEADILKFVDALISNTKGEGKEGDPFWTKSETLLYCALIAYIIFEGPAEDRNMNTLVDMISGMEVKEDDEDFMNAVDYMFAGLEKRKPDCFAVKQYKKYKLASGKTAKSILISCGARLAPFDIPQLREVMAYDELELDRIGDRKTAVFFIISDTTQTYNFLVALAFSQMFNLLCERADNVHGGRLPHHVRVLWDEAANTGQVPQLEKLVAVIRSREVSLCLLYQQLAQCKAIYDKHAETILGNMDSVVFLGGREASTIKEISENWLGKATISMQTDSRSRGQSESYSQNTQRLGRELMTPAELATMPGDKCILQLRGLPPFFSPKYDLKRHPNYRYTAEADKQKNAFDLDRLINRRRRPGLNEACTMYEVAVPDDALTEEDEDILNYDDIDDPDAFA